MLYIVDFHHEFQRTNLPWAVGYTLHPENRTLQPVQLNFLGLQIRAQPRQ
ncbi:MAG: hypothetical protein WC091_18725 [Sulfuricellaceae bacterium]